jgi:hypothetical protein
MSLKTAKLSHDSLSLSSNYARAQPQYLSSISTPRMFTVLQNSTKPPSPLLFPIAENPFFLFNLVH